MRALVVMCALCATVSVIGVVLVLHALSVLSGVQSFDHAQAQLQLQQAAAGAKIIPQAIATLERHLDGTITAAIQHAASSVAAKFGR